VNSRQRLFTALSRREPDRVPIDLGSVVTGITTAANRDLKAYLGLESVDPLADRVQQLAVPSEALLRRLRVDTRYIYINASRDWHDIELPGNAYQDEFGCVRQAAFTPAGDLMYYDFTAHPLSHIETVSELARFRWPDPHDPARFAGVEEQVRQVHDGTDYAVLVNLICSIFEFSWYLRGFEPMMRDLLFNKPLAKALLEAMCEYQIALVDGLLSCAGPYISVVHTGSDLGTQGAPMLSPALYREMIWPYYRRLWDFIKSHTQAKIFYHSCGSIVPMIPLLIEGGVDAIHPLQPNATHMGSKEGERKRLKEQFGRDIAFWGGLDQQSIFPFGTAAEVREATKRLLDDFMPGGGYVFCTGHNIQRGVPPENVLAAYDTVYEYGRYSA
jgi:uroporphyrinogen decarboxylase